MTETLQGAWPEFLDTTLVCDPWPRQETSRKQRHTYTCAGQVKRTNGCRRDHELLSKSGLPRFHCRTHTHNPSFLRARRCGAVRCVDYLICKYMKARGIPVPAPRPRSKGKWVVDDILVRVVFATHPGITTNKSTTICNRNGSDSNSMSLDQTRTQDGNQKGFFICGELQAMSHKEKGKRLNKTRKVIHVWMRRRADDQCHMTQVTSIRRGGGGKV